jgi:hypothetical protein
MEETAMVRSGRRPLALLAGCIGLAVIAGCAAATSAQPARPAAADTSHTASAAPSASAPRPSSPAPSLSVPPKGVNVAAFDALARQEASAWARSPLAKVWRTGLVVLQADDLSSGPSGGFPSGAAKLAFINGDLVFTGPPPSAAPAGVVTWPDGSTMKVPVLSEAQVFGDLTGSRQCPGCATTPLAVTAARPTTLDVATSRGRASVPAWAFILKGVSAPVIQAALPPGSYVTPNTYGTPTENVRPLGTAFVGGEPVWPSADGQTLTVGLPGSPCDTTWGGLDAEVGGVVVVGGWMQDQDLNPDQSCAAVLELRKVTVRLAAPLGDRIILNAATGQPVTPEPAPAGP